MLSDFLERFFAGRWIAGPAIGDAVSKARELNSLGEEAILNYLGEQFTEKEDVEDAVSTYLRLIRDMGKNRLRASIAVKITQLGLLISEAVAMQSYGRIVAEARKRHIFVWLDMESHDTIDSTIETYLSQARKGGVGIAIQSYLKRSGRDVQRLVKQGAVVRLVKGAYKESEEIAFRGRAEITSNYARLLRYLFEHAKEFTIATHDGSMIDEALLLSKRQRRKVTYAMLNGIRSRYAAHLASKGKRVAIYVPFGRRWVNYALRRLKEKEHVLLVLRSLVDQS